MSFDQPLLSIEQLVFLHTVAVAEFGGHEGIRDRGVLEAALARPLTGSFDTPLFATPFERTAALFESLLRLHPFIDGNKRTAVLAAAFWLEREGYELTASQGDLVSVTLSVVNHETDVGRLAAWLQSNSVPTSAES